ncbi:MAG: DUF5694 domain-containing protein [Bacteroidota bacterium]
MLRGNRQKEVARVVQDLVRFRPAKVVVDVPHLSVQENILNRNYDQYLEGFHPLNRSLNEQIGFRLAAMMQHNELFGIDDAGGVSLGSELLRAGNDEHAVKMSNLVRGIEMAKQTHSAGATLGQYISYLNQAGNLDYEHSTYVRMLSRMDNQTSHAGTDILSEWYAYHMRLFSNLTQITEKEGDRVLIILDSSHIPVLRDLIQADPGFELIPVQNFLQVN